MPLSSHPEAAAFPSATLSACRRDFRRLQSLQNKDYITMTNAWPKELRVTKDRRSLTVTFDNGESYDLTAELLRVASPSAEVQGHSPEQRVTVPGKMHVEIARMEPVGNYAVRIVFDDMHDTGLFSWDYLMDLGRNKDVRWQTYLDELIEKGLSREPLAPRRAH